MWKKCMAACLTLAVAVSAGMSAQNVQASEELVGIQAALESQAEEAAEQNTEAQSDILIAYFTWAENAVIDETVDAVTSPSVTEPGNVGQLAGWVQEETGGDLFSIKVTDPYPVDWDACLERANEERGNNARPELEENVSGLEQYETVFLGYPNWWYGVPMALLSFLEDNDLSGKDVYLFCSHGTGGLANSVEQIAEASPETVISDNIFDCYEEDASSSEDAVRSWASDLGYSRQKETESDVSTAEQRQISVQFGENTAVYILNDGSAADSLYEMLPLTVEVEDYSNNEKND